MRRRKKAPHRLFCYCCKRHVEFDGAMKLKDAIKLFNAHGHVNDRDSAKKRYHLSTNFNPSDKELGLA